MQWTRFVRTLVLPLMPVLAVFVLGCSGQGTSTPPDDETRNTIKAEMKADRKEARAAEAEASREQKASMKNMMKRGRGPG